MARQNVSGNFTGTGNSGVIIPRRIGDAAGPSGSFNMNLSGTFVGTVVIERSFDGTNFFPLTALGNAISFTAPCSEILDEPEDEVQYRLRCSAYTSGSIAYRLSC